MQPIRTYLKYSVTPLLILSALMGSAQVKQGGREQVVSVTAQTVKGKPLTGIIRDAATRKPLPGVTVKASAFLSAITDDKGEFKLNVPSYSSSVVIIGDGYQSKEVALKGRSNIVVDIYQDGMYSLYEQSQGIFEKKPGSALTSASTNVSANDNWARPFEVTDNYLQGKVAGLQSIRRSGTPGAGADLLLRGYNSLYGTNRPLIIVDGMIYNDELNGNSIIENHFTNPLSQIDIKDIDNITVIRDASSVYGTKGANGVILVSTARAKEQATKIDLAIYGGYNLAPANTPVMDGFNYRNYLGDLLSSAGLTPTQISQQPYMVDDTSSVNYYRYHQQNDWQKKVLDNSFSQNIYLKVTGGDEIATYALMLGYVKNGAVLNNSSFSRYSTRFNGNLNLSKKLTAVTSLSFTYNDQQALPSGMAYKINPLLLAQTKAPFLSERELSDKGIASPNLADVDIFGLSNPVAAVENIKGTNRNYRFFGSINFNYEFNSLFSLSNTTGVSVDKVRENIFIPRKGIANDTLLNTVADSRMASQVKRLFSLYNDLRLNYHQKFDNVHDVKANIGTRYMQTDLERDFGYGYNSATDEMISVGTGVGSLRKLGGSIGKSRWINTYFSARYGAYNKYFLDLNVAMDGSSRFGKEADGGISIGQNKFAVLPSVGASWLISSENFMARQSFIEMLKLRASYGLTGNDDIGNYNARTLYVSQNILGIQGLVRGNIGNPGLKWETNTKANLGLDISLLNERITLSADIYDQQTKDMIIMEPTPTAAGFSYALTNSGSMRTRGVELALNARMINHRKFSWDAGFTFARSRSKVTSIPETLYNEFAGATYQTAVGQAPNLFYGYKTAGVFATQVDADAANLKQVLNDGRLVQFNAGDVRFVDLNNDSIIDNQDKTIIGNPNPKFFGSFNTKMKYGNWSFEALFAFAYGNEIYNYSRRQLESVSGFQNGTENVMNRWKYEGQVTNMPKATYGDPMQNSRFSDRWIEDGSYLRLRNVNISYHIPITESAFKYATVYVSGDNVFTLTRYLGYDPEFSASSSVFAQGIDLNLQPQFRSFTVGVKVGL